MMVAGVMVFTTTVMILLTVYRMDEKKNKKNEKDNV